MTVSSKRRLVVCTDGTWNDPLKDTPTNVVKIARAVRRRDTDGVTQVVYYHPGVGTGAVAADRVLGGATGLGISRNICDAYNFIVQNYDVGDEIFLFGFSRGAYTARSIAGLIRNSGILRPECGHRLNEAYELYRSRGDENHPNSDRAKTFRSNYGYDDSRIDFVGVWDTVGALGVPLGFARYALKLGAAATGAVYKYEFHDVALSSFVDHAYHAVAMGERREAFQPTLWTASQRPPEQSFEQVWFRGVHCDVGGGYPQAGLSDAALKWMMDRAQRHGLALDVQAIVPEVTENYDQPAGESQRLMYRAVAVLKKLNALTLAVGFTAEEAADLRQRVDWAGNYTRPVPTDATLLYAPSRVADAAQARGEGFRR
jgi:uncharacterized protein (DUF2235 family)